MAKKNTAADAGHPDENKKKDEKGEKSPAKEGGGEAPEKGGGKKRLIIIGAGAAALVITVAVALFFFLGSGDAPPEPAEEDAAAETAAEAGAGDFFDDVFPLEPFEIEYVKDEKVSTLKFEVQIEVLDEVTRQELASVQFGLGERIRSLMRNKDPESLGKIENKIALKQEIIGIVNSLLNNGRVRNIYFTEFLLMYPW